MPTQLACFPKGLIGQVVESVETNSGVVICAGKRKAVKYEFCNFLRVEFYNGNGTTVVFFATNYNFGLFMFSRADCRHSGGSISALETYQPGAGVYYCGL